MASRKGRCTNFGNCELADASQPIEIVDGNELVCPKCGHQLAMAAQASGGRSSPLIPLLAIGAVLLGAAGLGYWMLGGRNSGGEATPAPMEVRAQKPVPQPTIILRLHGSNTIGDKLGPELAAGFLKQQGGTSVKIVPTSPEEVRIEATFPGDAGPKAIDVRAHGSSTGFTDLAAGKCDIAMSSRRVKPEEVTVLSSLGDMTSAASEHVVGLDGVAVIVNRANGLGSLTREQLQRVFAGEITDWKQLQGSAGAVHVYRRDDKSGTTDTFKSLVMGNRPFVASGAVFEDSRQLAEKVGNDSFGIGFVGLPYIGAAKAVAVSETGAKALLPTRLTVATEDYPLSRRLFLYAPANPAPMVRSFIEFALSKAGQDIVADAGFVSQNVSAVSIASNSGGSAEYQKMTATAERLSLNFRFHTGSSRLDNKAIVDIDRVVSFIGDLRYTGDSVMLFGFADARGGRDLNVRLSKDRANAVAAEFAQRGLKPSIVTGFGSDLPVASNDTEDGRERNRRVEIWVKKK
jgi:phosphate transport system substrate-binding protein